MPHSSPLARRIVAAPLTLAVMVMLMTVSTTSAASIPGGVGYKDFSYTATSVNVPSSDKPQSKVWYTDGSWWGGLFNNTDETFHIYKLETNQTWTDTGVIVDPRNNSHADYTWDETSQKLYVASAHPTLDQRVYRFSYNASTGVYSLDAGFPAIVGTGGSESLTLAKDSTDQLWVAFTQADADPTLRNVIINYTTTADQLTWAGPTVLPTQGADQPSADDLAAIIALGGNKVGIMWSSQTPVTTSTFFYWSEHADAAADLTWSTPKMVAATGPVLFANDHINLKLASTNSGEVLAAVKTEVSSDNILLLDYKGGTWTTYAVFQDPGDQSRPQLVVDEEHNVVYVFATDNDSGGDIIYRSAPMSDLASISTAPIQTFIDAGAELVNDFSTTKQNVNSTTGILGIATSSTDYFHNFLSLGSLTGATFVPLAPARLLDTRVANGLSGPFSAGVPRTFQVTGRGGVPANATAVTGNLTVTNASGAGYAFLGPDPVASPTSSTLNFPLGDSRANGVTVALGAGGTLSATLAPSGTVDLIFDVTGYFVPDATGATFVPLAPARLLDTRVANGLSGPFSAGVPRTFQVTGRGGVPASATAVTGNLTVTNASAAGYAFLGPNPTPAPTSSTLNFPLGDSRANGVTVALGAGGTLSATLAPSGTVDLIFDVTGYFVPDATGATFVPLAPARLLDTRVANGLSGPFSAGVPRTFQVTGRGGVPASATAVTGNLTVTGQTKAGFVFLGPAPVASPTSSTLNFPLGDSRANGVTVALSDTGSLSATYAAVAGGTTQLIFDVTGYFVP